MEATTIVGEIGRVAATRLQFAPEAELTARREPENRAAYVRMRGYRRKRLSSVRNVSFGVNRSAKGRDASWEPMAATMFCVLNSIISRLAPRCGVYVIIIAGLSTSTVRGASTGCFAGPAMTSWKVLVCILDPGGVFQSRSLEAFSTT